jgi:hypothetical protein
MTYNPAEVSQAIRDLSTAQKTLLVKIAKAYVWKTSYGYEDLIQEAFDKSGFVRLVASANNRADAQ